MAELRHLFREGTLKQAIAPGQRQERVVPRERGLKARLILRADGSGFQPSGFVGSGSQGVAMGKRALLRVFLRLLGWIAVLFAPRSAIATARTRFFQSWHLTTPLHA